MALSDHIPTLLEHVTQALQAEAASIKTRLVEAAMRQEAPDIEALGSDTYESMLGVDTESPNMEMVMLMRDAGQPAQPIVLLLTDFGEPAIEWAEDPKVAITVTPIAGEQGWQQFQQQRAHNNLRD